MPRLVSITLTALIDDNVEADSLADVIFNHAEAPVSIWAENNDLAVDLLEAEVTLNVEAEVN